MAILERTRELGMLMAIGTPKPFLFRLILLETLFLSGIGAPFGLLISVITVYFTGTYGLDFSSFSQGLAMYGMGNYIYPELKPDYLVGITLLIFDAALLSAIYPAVKAIKLKPLEAIRNH
jgi:ABC-type lipoprotein release transport system permease subunit